jgi:hypothetical protein
MRCFIILPISSKDFMEGFKLFEEADAEYAREELDRDNSPPPERLWRDVDGPGEETLN